eukprot:g75988.t1
MPEAGDRGQEKRQLSYNPPGLRHPGEYGLPFEEHYLTTEDEVKIHCFFVLQPKEKRETAPNIVFLHGNAGNIGFRLQNCQDLHRLVGCNVLLIEYRGYGNSQGTPSEWGLVADGRAGIRFLLERDDLDHSQIFLFGRSLGGAVALTLARQNPDLLRGVVVENTFTSIDDMTLLLLEMRGTKIKRGLWCLQAFLYLFLSNHWNNLKEVPQMRVPVLFISGMRDELVPAAHMRALYDATPASLRRMLLVSNGQHNNTYTRGGEMYFYHFQQFLSRPPPTLAMQFPSASSPPAPSCCPPSDTSPLASDEIVMIGPQARSHNSPSSRECPDDVKVHSYHDDDEGSDESLDLVDISQALSSHLRRSPQQGVRQAQMRRHSPSVRRDANASVLGSTGEDDSPIPAAC